MKPIVGSESGPGNPASRKSQNLSRFHPKNFDAPEAEPVADAPVAQAPAPSAPPAADTILGNPSAPAEAKIARVEVPTKFRPPIREGSRPRPFEGVEAKTPRPAPPEPEAPAFAALKEILPREIPFTPLHAVLLSAAILVGLALAFFYGQSIGRDEAVRLAAQTEKPEPAPPRFSEQSMEALDAALALLRDGKSAEALDALKEVMAAYPGLPSLQYAASIAALQAGYPVEADKLADASIRQTSRVSDALALKAAISASRSGRPNDLQEELLQQAIAADPMNPSPFLELASLMRYQGKPDVARRLLLSAALRMNPVDSRTVLDTTLALMSQGPSENPGPAAPTGVPEKDFPAALAELRSGNYESAAAILRNTRQSLPPDLFAYLINDPSLRKFADRPELSGLY